MQDRIGFGKRLGALCIDVIISVVGGMVVGALLGGVLGAGAGAAAGGESAAAGAGLGGILGAMAGAVLGIAVVGVLYGLIEGFTGASPGKMMLGIKIGNADGTKASVGKLLLRYLIKNVSLLCKVLAGIMGVAVLMKLGGLLGLIVFIGCFFALGSSKQALHDRIVKSAVYPKGKLTGAAAAD